MEKQARLIVEAAIKAGWTKEQTVDRHIGKLVALVARQYELQTLGYVLTARVK